MDDRFGDSHGDTGLNSAWLSYEEVRAGVGAEWKINSSFSLTIGRRLHPLAAIRFPSSRRPLSLRKWRARTEPSCSTARFEIAAFSYSLF